ncbi:DMT family transporter [Rhodococcus koreensis]
MATYAVLRSLDMFTSFGSARSTHLLFMAVTTLWGIPYLLTAIALDAGWGPMFVAAGRTILGAAVLLVFVWRGALAVLRTAPWRLIVLAAVEVAVPFTLIAWGEQTVSSSTAGVLIATEPAFVLCATWLIGRHARVPRSVLGGIAVGFLGVVMLFGAPGSGQASILILVAAASYGLGAVLVEAWFPDTPRLPLAAAMLITAALPMAVVAGVTEPAPAISASGVAAMAILGAVCTAGGFAAFFALIRSTGAASAAVITYTAPLIALGLGIAVRSDPITLTIACGTALILSGAWMTMRSPTADPTSVGAIDDSPQPLPEGAGGS